MKKSKRLKVCLSGDAPKGQVRSRAQRKKDEAKEREGERRDRHGLSRLSMQEMMGVRQLSVQSARMKEEQRQTAILAYTTQEAAVKSQLDSARQLAVLACPVYDETNVHWIAVHDLMKCQAEVVKKMNHMSQTIESSQLQNQSTIETETEAILTELSNPKKRTKVEKESGTSFERVTG